jgi:hypothetical protein
MNAVLVNGQKQEGLTDLYRLSGISDQEGRQENMEFDAEINRFGTHSVKWDMMEPMFGVPASEGIAMWVADMEFRPPACVQRALEGMLAHGVYGYYGDDAEYLDAIRGRPHFGHRLLEPFHGSLLCRSLLFHLI